jgi:UDP:flavonoid glycosyltransferase YjiC (YdhE family)
VHVARWVPQADVMPYAAAMICHGGSGTVRAGLAAGVPMAVLPLFADQPHNARRVTELGAGLTLDRASRAGDAVRWLLADPAYRKAAQRIAEATRRLPPVDTAVDAVHGLVARRAAA